MGVPSMIYERRIALKAIVNSAVSIMEYCITGRNQDAIAELDFVITKCNLLRRELKSEPVRVTSSVLESDVVDTAED